ncbi:MAG: ribonuclease HI [Paludibacter sp.]|nr:ribonuclease HI [Paludibacter sp.]
MNPVKLNIHIDLVDETKIGCRITDANTSNQLLYYPVERTVEFSEQNVLVGTINKNYDQFEKVIRSAIDGKIRKGQKIRCVFIENFPFLKEADFDKYIIVDRRNNKLEITMQKVPVEEVAQIYADGSYASETKQSGLAVSVYWPDGQKNTFSATFHGGSNNQMELKAVIEGLKLLTDEDTIQVNTDSRYVIRGLAQWIHFWCYNDWQSAYGQPVKFARDWQEADALCRQKRIIFYWVKGHSGNEEHGICHDLAKHSAIIKIDKNL